MDPNTPQQAPTQQTPQQDIYYGSSGGSSNLKKIVFIAVGFLVLIAIIVGLVFLYGKIKGENKNENVTLTYWGVWDDSSIMQPVIDDFERQHPNIKIQYQMQDIKGLGDYTDRIKTRIEQDGSDMPDIVTFHSSWTLALHSYLSPFPNAFIKDTKLDSDYYKTVQRDMKVNGAYYGIPLGIDTLALFVNTKLLNQVGLNPPKDWNDVNNTYAPRLLVKQNGKIVTSSIALGTYNNIEHAPDIMAMLLLQSGADLKDLSGASVNNAQTAFQFYTNYSDPTNGVWDNTLDNSKVAFEKGNLAMYFGYSWDILDIKAANPDLQFTVVKVPQIGNHHETVASYWAEGVSVKSKHPREALEFLDYLSQPTTLQKLYKEQASVRGGFGTLYPRRSMASLLQSNKLVYPFLEQADDAQSTFFSSDTFDGESGINSQMNTYMGNAINSINNSGSVQSAVETLGKGVAQVLSHYAN